MTIDLDPIQTLAAAILVLFVGSFVLGRVGFLRNNNVPVPVVGGICFALLTSLLYGQLDTQVSFDMALKDPMMLVFFTTIDKVRFRKPVRPGAELRLHIEKRGAKGPLWKFSGHATVDGVKTSEAEFAAMIVDPQR